jgi:hypothetical protein
MTTLPLEQGFVSMSAPANQSTKNDQPEDYNTALKARGSLLI